MSRWAARRRAEAEQFKTIVPVSSSWDVENGFARPLGTAASRPPGRRPGEGSDMSAARAEIAKRIRAKCSIARGGK